MKNLNVSKNFKRLSAALMLSASCFMPTGITAVEAAPITPAEVIVSYVPGEKVWIPKYDVKLAGELRYPDDFEADKKYPAIVIVHPGGGVKEQTVALYAENLAKQGFITLTYDAEHQGESGGEPRFLEDPADRVEDVRCAVDFLTTLKNVDRERIGALGICAGGGYAVHTAETEARIKAVAGVSAVDSGRTRREGLSGSVTDEKRNQMLKDIAAARTAEANGETPRYIHYVYDKESDIPAGTEKRSLGYEGWEYYRTKRGQHPRSGNRYLYRSLDKMFAYTAFDHVDWIAPRAILLIAGEKADTKYMSEDAYAKAKGNKELYIIPEATHIDLYDRAEYMAPAINKLAEFYGNHLK